MSSKLKEWIERNPLRVWRKMQKCTIMEVAAMLNVSALTVAMWEHGGVQPNDDNWVRLCSLLEDWADAESLLAAWQDWLHSTPRV